MDMGTAGAVSTSAKNRCSIERDEDDEGELVLTPNDGDATATGDYAVCGLGLRDKEVHSPRNRQLRCDHGLAWSGSIEGSGPPPCKF